MIGHSSLITGGLGEGQTVLGRRPIAWGLVGPLRMNRAVLPYMRTASRVLLLQVSTSVARVPMPFMSVYCAKGKQKRVELEGMLCCL